MGLRFEQEAARKQLAERIQAKQDDITEAKRELNRKKAELDEQENRLRGGLARANVPLPAGDACPNCWVLRGREVRMTPQPSEDDSDVFRCRDCGYEVSYISE